MPANSNCASRYKPATGTNKGKRASVQIGASCSDKYKMIKQKEGHLPLLACLGQSNRNSVSLLHL